MIRGISVVALMINALFTGQYTTYSHAGGPNSTVWPVNVPAGATSYSNLEQQSGWVGDSTYSVSGAYAPAVCQITPGGSGNPCPGAGGTTGGTYSGAGGGSTFTLSTTGDPGYYSGWMARLAASITCTQLHMLLTTTMNFSGDLSSLQAMEFGRRLTNCSQVTDNGQTELVNIGGGLLRVDYVPNGAGAAWTDSGCRFPMFVAGTNYTYVVYYVNDPDGSLSIPYVSMNGVVCAFPASSQHQGGVVESPAWTAGSVVYAFQPDDNTVGGNWSVVATLNAKAW